MLSKGLMVICVGIILFTSILSVLFYFKIIIIDIAYYIPLLIGLTTIISVFAFGLMSMPNIECWLHDDNDKPASKGRWKSERVFNGVACAVFGMFIKNTSNSSVSISRVTICGNHTGKEGEYNYIFILNSANEGTKILLSDQHYGYIYYPDQYFDIKSISLRPEIIVRPEITDYMVTPRKLPEDGPFNVMPLRNYVPFAIEPYGYRYLQFIVPNKMIEIY